MSPAVPRRRAHASIGRILSALILFALLPHAAPAVASDSAPPAFFTGSPDAATFLAGAESELAVAQKAVAALLGVKERRTIENTLVPYNEAVTHAENAAYQSHLMESVHPDSTFRAGAEEMTQKASRFLDELGLDRQVYDALRAVDARRADAATRYFLQRTLDDYRRAGVDKDDATRKRIAALLDRITKTGQEFQKNVRDDTRRVTVDGAAELDGLPEDYVKAHAAGPDGKITLTTDYPDYFPVLRYAKSGDLRRRLMHEDRNRGYPANLAVLDSLLAQRYRLARMLGYATYADYITEDKMIGSAKNAAEFIERLRETTFRRAQDEYALYVKRKQEDDPAAKDLNRWDVTYYGRLIRKRDFDFDPQEIRPYLPFERVKQGVLDVTAKTFGLTYRRMEGAAVWHPSVEAYEVYDGDRLLGRFFLDLHPRAGKYKHAARFGIRQGAAGIQVPEAALICNFPGGKPDDPGLMEHSDVATFFHEFGHLLHSIIGGQGRWSGVSGTAVQRDFVEAPSQLLEEWCRDASVLRTFAKHYQTGEPVPADLVERMNRSDAFGRALSTSGQVFLSAVSLNCYNRPPGQVDTDRLVRELEPRYTPIPPMPGTHMQTSFEHLYGYSAIYYTYQWSLVISKDLLSRFDRANLLDPGPARRYRDIVLAPGGSKPARDVVREFLGRDYDFKAYDAWLAGRG